MKLKRVRTLPSVKLAGRIPGDLHETLTAYVGYYRDVHGEAIETWPLLVHMLSTFLDEDRAFQTWRRRTNGSSVSAQAGPENGTRSESVDGQQ